MNEAAALMRRSSRLRTSDDFQRVHRTGVRIRSASVVTIAAPGTGDVPLVGVTASRRVGGAVKRNRSKRRLRAGIRIYLGRLAPGSRVILQATERTSSEKFQKLVEDIGRGLSQGGALDA